MNKRKLIGALIGAISFICTIIVGVYAMYTWKSDNTDVTFNIGDSYFYCESGFDTTVKGLSPVLDYRNGSYHTFKVNNIGKSDTKFSVTLNITKADASLLVESFKYKLVVDKTGGSNNCADTSNSSCVELDSGNFSTMKVGLNTIAESVELPNNSKYQYYLFMYIDGNMENDTSMQNSSITSTLEVCEIVAFLEYNGGNVVDNKDFLKVTSTYTGLPDTVTKDSVTVSYNTQGGNSIDNSTVSYTFDGWYTEKDFTNKVTSSSEVKTSINHTLYAKYTDSGSITLPTPTRSGYTFNGWYDKASGGTKIGNAGASYTPAKSITLYAHWTANKYTVTLDNQGATTAGTTSVTATYGSALPNITVPDKKYTVTYNYNGNGSSNTSTDVAYVFGGYYIGDTNVQYYTASGTSARNWAIASSGVLYAKWTGAGTVTLPTPTRTGYTFSGWYTASSGGTKVGDGGASYKPSSSITLYAQWVANELNFTNQTITKTYSTSSQTATITSASNGTGSYTYSEVSEKNSSGTSTNYITISGTTITIAASTPAGTYTYIIRATDSNSKVTKDATYTINISRAKTAVSGSCKTNLVYNGSAQTLASGGSNVSYSNNSVTNAGTHTVTVTSNSNYAFSDGSTSKTLSCSIAKATPTITLSATSGTVVKGKTMTFTEKVNVAGRFVAGKFTNTSGTTSVATVSPTSNSSATSANPAQTVTVTGVSNGTATITINFTPSDTTNYNNASAKTYTANITNSATIPTTSQCVSRTYTGSAQTIATAPTNAGYTLSGDTQTNAGSYTVTATLASGYRWSDNSTEKITFSCSIAKATPTITLSAKSGTVVKGKTMTFTEKANVAGKFTNTSGTTSVATVSPTSNSSAVSANTAQTVTVTGVSNGSSTITINFTPTDTTNYNNATAKTYTAAITNSETKPTTSQCVSRTYTGSAQTIATAPTNAGYTLSGDTQTNAGSYTVTATLASGYRWSDNSTEKITFSCSIAKATPTITLSATSGTITSSTITFTEKANVAGRFTNTSGNTSIATVSPASNSSAISANTAQTVTVTGVTNGTSTITVNFTPSDTANYNNASAKAYTVTVANTYTLSITKGTGVGTIYYKVNGASSYTSSSSNVSVKVKSGTTYYYYGIANTGYTMSSCTASSPCSDTMGTSNVSKSLSASLNYYNVTIIDGATINGVTVNGVTMKNIVKSSGWYSEDMEEYFSEKTYTFAYGTEVEIDVSDHMLLIGNMTFITPIYSGYLSGYTNGGEFVVGIPGNGTITDIGDGIITSDVTITYNITLIDSTPPTSTLTTTNNLKATSQTATLGCSDTGSGIAGYYWGTNSTYSSNTYTSGSMSSTTKVINSAGTYYLTCKDNSGNVSTKSLTFNSYKVQNMLLNIKGTSGTYTTGNYTQSSSSTYIAKSGTSLTLASIYTTPTGGTFKGISTGAASTSSASVSTTAPTLSSNATYAMWFDRNTYTITVNSETGGSLKVVSTQNTTGVTASSGSSKSLVVRYGDTITATATANTGYHLSSVSGLVTSNGGTKQITSTGTVTASWSVNTYTIKYNANGGSGTMSTTTCTYGSDCILRSNSFTKTGYHFSGWATSSGGSVAHSNGAKVKNLTTTNGGTVNLYAKWTANTLNIRFNKNGGTCSFSSSRTDLKCNSDGYVKKDDDINVRSYSYGETITEDLPDPDYAEGINIIKTGYHPVDGSEWCTGTSGGGECFDDTKVYTISQYISKTKSANSCDLATTSTCTLTLYVHWTKNTVSLKFHMNKGELASTHGSNISYSGDYITKDKEEIVRTLKYEETGIDLPNYNNEDSINITRTGYTAVSDKEWFVKNKSTDEKTYYNQSKTTYTAAGIASARGCDIKTDYDCTVIFYVNWEAITLSVQSSVATGTGWSVGKNGECSTSYNVERHYKFRITTNDTVSSGRLCFANNSTETPSAATVCTNYSKGSCGNLGSGGYGKVYFESDTVWHAYRSKYYVYMYVRTKSGNTASKSQGPS